MTQLVAQPELIVGTDLRIPLSELVEPVDPVRRTESSLSQSAHADTVLMGTTAGSEQLPALPDPHQAPETPALRDFREQFMMAPVAVMQAGLAEYKDRRKAFRGWLKEQLIEGVHFGFSPGCEPKYCDASGNIRPPESATHVKSWSRDKWLITPFSQWTPKPSLYKAGADFLCDLLWARDEYKADLESWQQLGSPAGTFVMGCYLYSRSTGELLGEGRGCRKNGQKGGDENNAIKMAKKCAKVDAVLNTWGLADLFTQDIEDDPPPPNPSSPADPNAPKAPPRGDRVAKADIDSLGSRWKASQDPDNRKIPAWVEFVESACNRGSWGTDKDGNTNVLRWQSWTPADVEAVIVALSERGA